MKIKGSRRPPADNAAIWYAPDGYEPGKHGINGRRVAGQSLLLGLFRHVSADELVVLTSGSEDQKLLSQLRDEVRPELRLRFVARHRTERIAPVGTVFYSAPNVGYEAWRRAPLGNTAYSLCGMTHATSTKEVTEGWLKMRTSPVEPWDAVICTSAAVKASVMAQMEMIDAYLEERFGRVPPMPQIPVVPLGIHCDDFRPDPALRARLRAEMNLGEDDILCVIIARLNADLKFDPLPTYIALQQAAAALPGQKIGLCLCGVFISNVTDETFDRAVADLMPDVAYRRLDGAVAENRTMCLSAADVFLFPIDNLQETFGLAPIEGMAAGLPVVVSDWDGMKDTISRDVGFRIPTRGLTGAHTVRDGYRFFAQVDSYRNFSGRLSAMTQIDVPEMARAIVTLATNPNLRRKMGKAAEKRARRHYDWAAVIPQMQDLWAELSRIRQTAVGMRRDAETLPVGPSPMRIFADYPTVARGFAGERFRENPERSGEPEQFFALRRYAAGKDPFMTLAQIKHVWDRVRAAGPAGFVSEEIARLTGLPAIEIDRVLVWFLKYDLIRPVH